MRQLTVERPVWVASASRVVAFFALEGVLITLVLLRFSLVDFRAGIIALAATLAVAALALLLACLAFVAIWRGGAPGFGRAFTGFVLAILLLAPAGLITLRVLAKPAVNDITTDAIDPPSLAFTRADRRYGANPIGYDPANVARQQAAFPQIRSLLSDLPPDDLLKLAYRLVREKRWTVLSELPTDPFSDQGGAVSINAVVKSVIFGTVDDVSIRVREVEGRSRVDMRSAARYGPYDFGANARRVAGFLEELRTRALAPPASE